MFKRILVPLDGSALAESVIPMASYMAERFEATLIFLHIMEKDAPEEVHGQRHLTDIAEAHEYLAQLTARLSTRGLTVEQEVHEKQEAGVAQSIHSHALELHADLIVLCAHGRGGLRDLLFGSIAQQVIQQGTIPVLYARPDPVKGTPVFQCQQILTPLDGSEAHEVAVPVAAAIASKCSAKVTLLSVVPTADTLPPRQAITGHLLHGSTTIALDAEVRQAESYLLQIAQNLAASGLPVSVVVSRGEPASKMGEAVVSGKIDLIVMATHGYKGLDANWEGSLTPKILSSFHVPVLLVKGRRDPDSNS